MLKLKVLAALISLTAPPAYAGLVSGDVGYTMAYSQNAPGSVTAIGAFFASRAFFASAGDFTSGTVTVPAPVNASFALTVPQTNPPALGYSSAFLPSRAALEAAFPTGSYRIAVTNSQTAATASVAVDRSAPLLFPTVVPTISNFSSLQGINPAQAFTITLSSGFTRAAAATEAFTFLSITDRVTNVVVYNASFLAPSTQAFSIGAGTFAPGGQYAIDLVFSNRLTATDALSGLGTTVSSDVRTFANFTVPVGSVPEPSTWAFMLFGFALTGATLRYRRAVGVV